MCQSIIILVQRCCDINMQVTIGDEPILLIDDREFNNDPDNKTPHILSPWAKSAIQDNGHVYESAAKYILMGRLHAYIATDRFKEGFAYVKLMENTTGDSAIAKAANDAPAGNNYHKGNVTTDDHNVYCAFHYLLRNNPDIAKMLEGTEDRLYVYVGSLIPHWGVEDNFIESAKLIDDISPFGNVVGRSLHKAYTKYLEDQKNGV